MKQLEKFEKSFGKKINRVGFGGIPVQGLSLQMADVLVEKVLSRGINFIDTARGYTDSEAKIGRVIQSRRKDVFLATKSLSRTYQAMKQDIEISLNSLGTEMIDLYQFHNVMGKDELDTLLHAKNGAMRAIVEAKAESKIRFIGITGHRPETLVEAVKTGLFDSVQVPHNIIETGCEKELHGICKEYAIPVIAMKPVAGGALKEVAALNLRYVLTHGSAIVVPGVDRAEYIDVNLSILPAIAPLTDREMQLLRKEAAVWSGKFCRRCGYCMPCPQGLNIPLLLLLKAYRERYDLKNWVSERLAPLQKKYNDCTHCGECTNRCPYALPIPEMMEASLRWHDYKKRMVT